jgi:hypothetical protein
MNTTHTVVGQAKEEGFPRGHELRDIVEIRGEKPNRTLIMYEPCNKPQLVYVRLVETQDPELRGFFRYDGAWFVPDHQIGSDNPNGKGHAADSPEKL